jgi:hypothetical protein
MLTDKIVAFHHCACFYAIMLTDKTVALHHILTTIVNVAEVVKNVQFHFSTFPGAVLVHSFRENKTYSNQVLVVLKLVVCITIIYVHRCQSLYCLHVYRLLVSVSCLEQINLRLNIHYDL